MAKTDKYTVRPTGKVVADMSRDGFSPPEIAKALGISRQTVHYHLDKLEANERGTT